MDLGSLLLASQLSLMQKTNAQEPVNEVAKAAQSIPFDGSKPIFPVEKIIVGTDGKKGNQLKWIHTETVAEVDCSRPYHNHRYIVQYCRSPETNELITAVIAAPLQNDGRGVDGFVNSRPVIMLIYDWGIDGFSTGDRLRIFLDDGNRRVSEYTFGSIDKYVVQSWYTVCGNQRLEHHDRYGTLRKWFIDRGISGFNEDYTEMVGSVQKISPEIMSKIERRARERFTNRLKDQEHRSCFD